MLRRRTPMRQDLEKSILTMMIVSSDFLAEMGKLIQPDLFDLDVAKTVSRWVVNYFSEYNKSPGKDIQAIFLANKDRLKEEEAKLISAFLQQLSNDYLENPPESSYMVDQSASYFKKQKLKQIAANIQGMLVSGNNLRKAESLIRDYSDFSLTKKTWGEPLDPKYLNKAFAQPPDPLIEIPGELYKILGNLHRGWLVAFLGPPKRGKTWYMMDLATLAVMQRRRVIYVTLEMTDVQIAQRFYQNLGSFGKPDLGMPEAEYIFPALDCRWNQDNSCTLDIRTCRVSKPLGEFKNGQEYKPCSACQSWGQKSAFKPRPYFTRDVRPTLGYSKAYEAVKDFAMIYGDSLRILSYPAFSAKFSDILLDIDQLFSTTGFQADAVFFDYPDIFKPEDDRKDQLSQTDEIWKRLKAFTQERNCLGVVGTQGRRESMKKDIITAIDTSWDIRKVAHCDAMVGISQNEDDKSNLIAKINVLAHRWSDFSPYRLYIALQQLKVGQPNLGGYIEIFTSKK